MSGDSVCKYNQRGHCKYKQECRNKHENKLCPEESKCKHKECSMRHPKLCRNYFREGICRYGGDCSYKHEKVINKYHEVQDIQKQNASEINAIKDEMSKLKEIVSLMQNQIAELNQEIQSTKKINIAEIVGLVVSLLDNSKSSAESSTAANKTEISIDCDICDFKCENEKLMITHMSDEHEECYSCYLCANYFGTKQSLKHHNKLEHNDIYNLTESEGEDSVQTTSYEENKKQKEKKQRKKKKGAKK